MLRRYPIWNQILIPGYTTCSKRSKEGGLVIVKRILSDNNVTFNYFKEGNAQVIIINTKISESEILQSSKRSLTLQGRWKWCNYTRGFDIGRGWFITPPGLLLSLAFFLFALFFITLWTCFAFHWIVQIPTLIIIGICVAETV